MSSTAGGRISGEEKRERPKKKRRNWRIELCWVPKYLSPELPPEQDQRLYTILLASSEKER